MPASEITRAEERAAYVIGSMKDDVRDSDTLRSTRIIARAILEGALAIAAAIRTLKTEGK
jgi:hypothetical protein